MLTFSDQLVRCKVCERNFAQDRISLHEQICKKTTQKRRKQYDISAHRLQGTELEGFATTKAPNKRASEVSRVDRIFYVGIKKKKKFISIY